MKDDQFEATQPHDCGHDFCRQVREPLEWEPVRLTVRSLDHAQSLAQLLRGRGTIVEIQGDTLVFPWRGNARFVVSLASLARMLDAAAPAEIDAMKDRAVAATTGLPLGSVAALRAALDSALSDGFPTIIRVGRG